MRTRRLVVIGAAVALAWWIPLHARSSSTASAQPIAINIDVAKVGPQVGEQVPDFSLTDQNGKIWTRQSIMGPKGVMLVFYRSADWSPECKAQLLDLEKNLDLLRKNGLALAAISYDPQPVLAEFSRQNGITFPLLSDVGSPTIKRYRVLNTVVYELGGPFKDDPGVVAALRKYVIASGGDGRLLGIPFPGTFIVDPQGRVISRSFNDSFTVRTPVSEILSKLPAGY